MPHRSRRDFLRTTLTAAVAATFTGPVLFRGVASAHGAECVTVTASTNPWASVPFTAARNGAFEAVVEATPLATTVDAGVTLSNGPQTSFPGLACILRFHNNGLIDARNGAVYQADSVVPYAANTPYVIRFVVDVATHRYAVYVRPVGGAEQAIGVNYAFCTEQASVAQLDHHTLFADLGSMRACHFGDGCLVVAAGGGWRTQPLVNQTGVFTIEWDAVPTTVGLDAVMALSNGLQTDFNGYACLVRFHVSGQIHARNGTAYQADTAVMYTANTLYHFRLVVDVQQRRYDVFVTPDGGLEHTVALNYAFRTEQQAVTQLNHFGTIVDVGPGSVTICNVEVGESAQDPWGLQQIYPTTGMTWFSKWHNGHARTFGFPFPDDPHDPWSHGRGDARYSVDGNGILTATPLDPARAAVVRFYVYDPAYNPPQGEPNPAVVKLWNNVEATFYMKRVQDAGPAYAGQVLAAKIRHIPDSEACGTRGYYGRLRNNGGIDFAKEISHPTYAEPRTGQSPWSSYPFGQWIGMKYVCRDTGGGAHVKLEIWRDLTGGVNGGTWAKLHETIDSGGWRHPSVRCSASEPYDKIITGPNLSVFFRNDLGPGASNQVQYKWFSIREIGPA